MYQYLHALCILGLLVSANAEGKKAAKKKSEHPGYICQMTFKETTKNHDCGDYGECTLGPLVMNKDDNFSFKFCDGLNEEGTSVAASGACMISDAEGNVVEDRIHGHPEHCTLTMALTYKNSEVIGSFPAFHIGFPHHGPPHSHHDGPHPGDHHQHGTHHNPHHGAPHGGPHSGQMHHGHAPHQQGPKELHHGPNNHGNMHHGNMHHGNMPHGNMHHGNMPHDAHHQGHPPEHMNGKHQNPPKKQRRRR